MRRILPDVRGIAAGLAVVTALALGPAVLAQTISPMTPPEPIGKHPSEHTRNWYLQNGYHWDGHAWTITLAQRREPQAPPRPEPESAPAATQHGAEASAVTPQPSR